MKQIFTPNCYSKSEYSPDKIKRKNQRSQQAINIDSCMLLQLQNQTKDDQRRVNLISLKFIKIETKQSKKDGYSKIKNVYIELTRQTLKVYNNEKKNLIDQNFNIQQDKQIIKLQFPHLNQTLIYQAKDAVEAKMWVDYHRNHLKSKLEQQEIQRYFGINVIQEDYFTKKIVESEDLLLFDTGATKYDHIAIAIKMSGKYLFVFDANADIGVTFMECSQFIEINDLYEKWSIRQIDYKSKKNQSNSYTKCMERNMRSLLISFLDIINVDFNINIFILSQFNFDNKRVQVHQNKMKVFSVQNQLLKHLNIVDCWNHKNSRLPLFRYKKEGQIIHQTLIPYRLSTCFSY